MIVGPPGLPSTSRTRPVTPSLTMVGDIDESMRFRGAIAFASPITSPYWLGAPGFAAKSSISLLRKKPAPSTTTRAP